MRGRERIEEAVGVAAVVMGAIVALSQAHGPLAVIVVALILVEGGLLWAGVRKLGDEGRNIGNRLLILVGLALTTLGLV